MIITISNEYNNSQNEYIQFRINITVSMGSHFFLENSPNIEICFIVYSMYGVCMVFKHENYK